jgi:small GTP-binding protein
MNQLPSTRVLILVALLLFFLLLLIGVLFVTNLVLSVWDQLLQKPDWLIWSYLVGLTIVVLFFGKLVWSLLLPSQSAKQQHKAIENSFDSVTERLNKMSDAQSSISSGKRKPVKQAANEQLSEPASKISTISAEPELDAILDKQWSDNFEQSAEVAAIRTELEEFSRRQSQQQIYIALFGDISSGKSTLIKALSAEKNPDHAANIQTSVLGGTTREIYHYQWQQDEGHALILTDMPGLNEQYAQLELMSVEEVKRAHIAIYLCDGDLTSTQFNELQSLLRLKKPTIVVLNKSDRLNNEERERVLARIQERLADYSDFVSIVAVNAGGMREYIRVTPDGEEQRVQREVKPDVASLKQALDKILADNDRSQLEKLREVSVSNMIHNKLDDIDARFKHSQSRRMVKSYTKKAIVASMATISPGTDLLVQGYLGIQMIKDLCKLYGVSATDIDANKLVELIQSRMDKTLPLLLAIAGNGFKAFPGIGTVTGGLMHAVAYGMIFDTLGRSVARTLEVTGELSPTLVSDLYKEQLSENIESRTKDFIKLVLKLRKRD